MSPIQMTLDQIMRHLKVEMLKLSPNIHTVLNDRVIRQLKDVNISTVSELLHTNSVKLMQLLNIEPYDLSNLKADLWRLVGIRSNNGFQHHELLDKQSSYIPTGIKSLDELLGGGLLSGNLIDVCGLSASGKTQLYTTIALNWAVTQDYETFVVDTKGDFSGDRINRMLSNRTDINVEKRKHIMRNIKVEKCNDPFKLVELIKNLLAQIMLFPKCKLLVIDSLPALWFLFHGTKQSFGQRNLAILADLLRKLAVEHSIVVLTVNIGTRSILNNGLGDDHATDNIERNESDLMNRTRSSMMREKAVPALGKHWKSICSFRLQIERSSIDSIAMTSTTKRERTIRILKSNQNQTDIVCMVQLTDVGIT